VTSAHRTQGLGQRLVERAEHHARECGAATIYLLTTTAEAFFRSRDYIVTPRESAPPAILSTPEFAGLCPRVLPSYPNGSDSRLSVMKRLHVHVSVEDLAKSI
jgi:predicted GNAT family acetyltransferase